MKVNDFYNEVARRVDTPRTKINAAEARRVLSVAFQLLGKMSAAEFSDTLARAVASSNKKK